MKNKKLLLTSLSLIFININNLVYAQNNILNDLDFLNIYVEECLKKAEDRDINRYQRQITHIDTEINEKYYLPIIGFNSSLSLNKDLQYENFNRTNPDDSYTKKISANISYSQKLWDNNLSKLMTEMSEVKEDLSNKDGHLFYTKIQAELTKDIYKIIILKQNLEQRQKELKQWKLLNELMQKKYKNGNINKSDILQSNRELLSAQNEVDIANDNIEKELNNLNYKYDLYKNKLLINNITELTIKYEEIIKKHNNYIDKDNLKNLITQNSLELQKIQKQLEITQKEIEIKNKQIYNPELKLNASVGGNTLDNVNRVSVPSAPKPPDLALNASASLNFSMNIYTPRSYLQIEQNILNLRVLEANKTNVFKNIYIQLQNMQSDFTNLMKKQKNLEKTYQLSQELYEQNKRLYEAGFIDTFQLIKSLQDLYIQERSIMELKNQQKTLIIQLMQAIKYGQFF